MVMPVTEPSATTVEELLALPDDDFRHELLNGEHLVTPSPSWVHQYAVGRLWQLLSQYVRDQRVGYAIIAPADIPFDNRNLVQPDLFVVPPVENRLPRSWSEVGKLLLAVEVLSPTTARYDRGAKRALYQERDVPEYWIVDIDACLVERWRPDDQRPEILRDTLKWIPGAEYQPLAIDLTAYFTDLQE